MNMETAQSIELPGGFAANPVIIKGEGAPVHAIDSLKTTAR